MFKKSIVSILILASVPHIVSAATYYVDQKNSTASDTNPGTSSSPFLTVQKAADMVQSGDTVIVRAGTYNEHVRTKGQSRIGEVEPSSEIRYKAEGKVRLASFFIRQSYTTIEGFEFYRPRQMWTSAIHNKDVNNLKNIKILNNSIVDGIYVTPTDAKMFMSPTGTNVIIQSPSVDFFAEGFEVGIGLRSSCPDVDYAGNFKIESMTKNELVTSMFNTATYPNINSPTYCFMSVNTYGISIDAENYLIKGNTMRNLAGNFINLDGKNGIVEDNDISDLNTYDVFRIFGENHVIRNNFVRNSVRIRGNGNHPDLFQNWGNDTLTAISRNILIEKNFFHNMDSQICQLQPNADHKPELRNPGVRDFTVRGNVFSKISNQANSGLDDIDWINNTFVLNGGTGGDGGGLVMVGTAIESSVVNSIFVRPNDARNNTGWYGGAAPDFYADYNFVSGAPPTYRRLADKCPSDGWSFCEAHGINGGDPLFKNIFDPIGPDGKPWTADDGLIPLATSPVCNEGEGGKTMGAYDCQGCTDTNPIAYMGTDKSEGFEILTVNFDASKSLSCASGLSYEWDFGDGTTATGVTAAHQYADGIHTATLKVTNSLGKTKTVQKVITVFPTAEPNLVLYLNYDGNITDMSGRKNYVTWGNPDAEMYVAGRFGEAASLDPAKTGSSIEIRHQEGLDGNDLFTISFWAKKDVPAQGSLVVLKHGIYNISLGAKSIGGYLNTDSGSAVLTSNVSNEDTNWHHYAVVYDGAEAKVYFDGAVVATKPLTGKVKRATDRPLTLGKDPWGKSLDGAMDEFKIYDRDLTADDIKGIYENKPQPDTTPPSRRNPLPKTVASGSTKTSISITANEAATCRYSNVPGVLYDDMVGMMSASGMIHSAEVTGLSDGQTYKNYVRCRDVSGNTNGADFEISFYVLKPGETPPSGETPTSPGTAAPSMGVLPFKNIFNPNEGPITMKFATNGEGVSLVIFDRSGNEIKTLSSTSVGSNEIQAIWDGRNTSGGIVSSGVYVVVYKNGGSVLKKKIVVVK